ncbi:VOC family protein [Paenibacillus alkalitolerans]|uniref:VOC family protein n=1 Tax=Paenibacillus alkalitolerans TaxID=2799335 RepID=UPI0018F5E6A4|nr:VOC family protein [Paenibacillus alkalitolerans]
MNKPLAKMPSGTLFVKDLQESIKWYNKAFGFQVVSINPNFSTMEYAPGRCLFFNKDEKSSRKLVFFCKNIEALRRQLVYANVEMAVDEESLIKIIDLNGNIIEVWNNKYEMNRFQASMPDFFVNVLIRCRLESRGDMHLLARSIKDDIEFEEVSEELQAWCQQHNIPVMGEPFITSQYSGQVRDEPYVHTKPSGQIDKVYACIPLKNIPRNDLPADSEYIYIPPQDYTVFPIDYTYIDTLRNNELRRRSHFMNPFFRRPEGSFYIHEVYKDDFIYAYIPYEWCEGKRGHNAHESAPLGQGAVPRQYLDMLFSTLYASDPLATANWFGKVLGSQMVEESPTGIVMQISHGAYLMISTNEDSPRGLSLISDHTEELKKQLAEINIELTAQDQNNWFAFKGPDNNAIDVWRGGFGMERISIFIV